MDPAKEIAALKEKLKAAEDELAAYKAKKAADDETAVKAAKSATTVEKADVVYTADDGSVFTKSDDQRLVKMARERDEDRKALTEEILKGKRLTFAKRATDELGHLTGDVAHKVALLEVVETIQDETIRKAVTAILHSNDNGVAQAMTRLGTTGAGATSPSEPEQKIEKLAKALSTDKKISFAKAYAEVLESSEGRTLYAQIQTKSAAGATA
jgi:hypothetical protein